MTKPHNILHVISRLDGYGTTRQLRVLALAQLAEGNQVRIAALRSTRRLRGAWQCEGLCVSDFERRWKYDPFTVCRLTSDLLANPPELIHAWDLDAVGYVAVARLRTGGVPLVATLFAPPTGARLVSQVDRLAVSNEALRRDYADSGVAAEQLAVVPPAVPRTEQAHTHREQFLRELDLPPDAQLIAIAGPLLRAKRFDEAIWCFELVRTLNERAALVIFGDGPDQQRLQRFTRLASDPSAVRFLGYREDLGKLLSHANVFWHLSEEPSISAALLESMASRVPVVASDVPVHQELIEHGRTGFFAPVGSRAGLARHTLRLLEDEKLAREIGRAAAEDVSTRFSADMMAVAYRQLYNQLLSGGV